MLKLTPQRESRWLELAKLGIRVRVRPLTTAVLSAARAEAGKRVALAWAAQKEKAAAGFGPEDTADDLGNPSWREGVSAQYFAAALLRYAGEAWEGVGDHHGNPLPLNSVTAEAFAEHDQAATAFLDAALAPLDALAAEGNGSAPSSRGGGEGGASIAPAAATDAPPALVN